MFRKWITFDDVVSSPPLTTAAVAAAIQQSSTSFPFNRYASTATPYCLQHTSGKIFALHCAMLMVRSVSTVRNVKNKFRARFFLCKTAFVRLFIATETHLSERFIAENIAFMNTSLATMYYSFIVHIYIAVVRCEIRSLLFHLISRCVSIRRTQTSAHTLTRHRIK